MRAQSKTYGEKTNKQWYFERIYNANPNLSNKEIANILSYDVSETSKKEVEVMKSRYKAKLKAKLKGNDTYHKAINKLVKEEDVIQKYYKMIFNQTEHIAETKFEDEKVKLEVFKKLVDTLS